MRSVNPFLECIVHINHSHIYSYYIVLVCYNALAIFVLSIQDWCGVLYDVGFMFSNPKSFCFIYDHSTF